MSRLVARRDRIVRVRHVQHAQALADAMAARQEADAIADNATRLARVRASLFDNDGQMTGGNFAAIRELADRLERAGRQLDGALYDARIKVDQKQTLNIAASREKEIALRLKDRAVSQREERMEARIAAIPNHRRMQTRGAE